MCVRAQNNRENMGNDCSNFASNNRVHASGYAHAVYKVSCIRTFIVRLLVRVCTIIESSRSICDRGCITLSLSEANVVTVTLVACMPLKANMLSFTSLYYHVYAIYLKLEI